MVLAVIILLIAGLSIAALLFFVVAGICGGIATIPGILEKSGRPLRSRFLLSAIRILSRFPTALFFLTIFSVHFLGFNFVHGMFLNAFFPRVNLCGLFNSMEDGFHLYRTLLSGLITQYAPFILAGAVSQLPEYKKAYKKSPSTDHRSKGSREGWMWFLADERQFFRRRVGDGLDPVNINSRGDHRPRIVPAVPMHRMMARGQ